jgi:glycosyltransferase involved in cell wall biosynthesis
MGRKHATLRRFRYHAGTDWLAARADEAEASLATARSELATLRSAMAAAEATLSVQERRLRVATVMDWIAQADVGLGPLVSVVLPTRSRASLLPRAIESILTQSYPRWELIVVDDASTDDTAAVLASFDDQRIRIYRGAGQGVGAARNLALDHAKGDLIAYVDDDNRMHPEWLKSVVWGFQQRSDVDVLYGAFVVDDPRRLLNEDYGDVPQLYFHGYDHDALAQDNIADIGAIAHRAGLPEARFDESLLEMADWDLLLRLTRDLAPLALPAVACYYSTDAPNRLSNGPTHGRDAETIRERHRR